REEALSYTRTMLARRDVTAASRVDFGWVLLRDGDIRGAMEIAREIANRSSEREIAWRGLELLAATLSISHRQDEARDVIGKVEQIQGLTPSSLSRRAFAYASLGRADLAIDYAARVYALQPDSSAALWARGNALAATGRHDDAAADFVRLNDKYPDENCALARVGDVRLAQGNFDAAIAAYRRHEEAASKYGYLCAARADFGWGRALDAMGKPAEAARKFASAAARDADDVGLWR